MDYTSYLLGTYNVGVAGFLNGGTVFTADPDTGANYLGAAQPNAATYAVPGGVPCNAASVRYDKVTTPNTTERPIGFAWGASLSVQDVENTFTRPITVTGQILLEIYDTDTYPIPGGATLLFRSTLDLEFIMNAYPLDNTNYDYSETISTDVIGGQAIDPTDAVDYLDNGNVAELDGGIGSVSVSTWSKTFISPPYVMDLPDTFMMKATYTAPKISTSPVRCGFLLNIDAGFLSRTAPSLRFRPAHPFLDAIIEQDGALLTAVKDGDNLQAYRFSAGIASRETLGAIAAHRRPILEIDAQGRFFVGARRNVTSGFYEINEWYQHQSTDAGASFAIVPGGIGNSLISVLHSFNAIPMLRYCGRIGGGFYLVQLTGGTGLASWVLEFKRGKKLTGGFAGSDLEGNTNQYIVGSLPSLYEPYWIWQAYWNGGGDVFVSNGYDVIYSWSGNTSLTNTTKPAPGWTYWTPTIWDRDDYAWPHISGTVEGGMVTCAIKRGTNPLEVESKYSPDYGVTWDDAVAVGTLGALDGSLSPYRACQVWQRAARGCRPGGHPQHDNSFVLTNGYDKMWNSHDNAQTWEVAA